MIPPPRGHRVTVSFYDDEEEKNGTSIIGHLLKMENTVLAGAVSAEYHNHRTSVLCK